MHRRKTKTHDMCRSILPSTKRGRARRAKADLHRSNRRRAEMQTHVYRGYSNEVIDLYEERGDELDWWIGTHVFDYGELIGDRRLADKLNHFERWAYTITRNIDPYQRYWYMKAMLPDNLIGRHALSHLYWMDPRNRYFDPDAKPSFQPAKYTWYWGYGWISNMPKKDWDRRHELEAKLRALDKEGRQRFNAHIVKYASYWDQKIHNQMVMVIDNWGKPKWEHKVVRHEGARILHGSHDIGCWLMDVWAARRPDSRYGWDNRNQGFHPNWWTTALEYFEIG